MLVLHSVDAVLVDPAPDSGPVYLVVWKVVIKPNVAVLILKLVWDVGVKRDEDEELLGAAAPAGLAGLMWSTKSSDGGLQTWTDMQTQSLILICAFPSWYNCAKSNVFHCFRWWSESSLVGLISPELCVFLCLEVTDVAAPAAGSPGRRTRPSRGPRSSSSPHRCVTPPPLMDPAHPETR